MKLFLLLQRRLEAPPLLRDRVQHHRLILALEELEGLDQQRQVVSIHRPVVAQAELLEQHARSDQSLGRLFRLACHMQYGLAAVSFQQPRRAVVQPGDGRIGNDLVQIPRDRPHILVDRPRIVVQHHDQPAGLRGNVVHRLERDAVGKCRVPAQRDDMLLAAGHVPRHRHAQRRAERRARVAGAAFRPQHEAVEAPRLADRIEPVIAAGQQFVHIGLVGNVEDEAVARRVEDVVQGQRQLDDAQVGADVAAGLRDAHNQPLAYLLGKLRQLRNRQPLHIRRRLDPDQQFFHAFAYFGPLHPLAASAPSWPQPSSIPISLTRFAAYSTRSEPAGTTTYVPR